tara:strand:- start:164 stop:550 length:387 start_codon:yes stop_codon:yes gene_type:complete
MQIEQLEIELTSTARGAFAYRREIPAIGDGTDLTANMRRIEADREGVKNKVLNAAITQTGQFNDPHVSVMLNGVPHLMEVEAGYVWRVLMFVEIEEKTKGTNLIAFDLAGSYNEPAPATCTEQTCGCG